MEINNKYKKEILRIAAIAIYGVLAGIGINLFLTPNNVYSGGLIGLAQMLYFLGNKWFGVNIGVSIWIIVFNAPLIVLSWIKLGKKFTIYTLLTVLTSSFFMALVPIKQITDNTMLAAIFGGILYGAGVGICFRLGFSTGGTDIIVMVVQRMTGKSVGQLGFLVNGSVVVIAGLINGWEVSLYSLIAIYATTKMMDSFYIQQYKVTVNIITSKKNKVCEALLKNNLRGVTVFLGVEGGYTKENKDSIMTVISKPELLYVKKIVQEVDEDAFINVQPTIEVVGKFLDKSYY